jgi:2-polyprenyl-3-methyl-5-hydroxy-6-metoxy-1,4-benzoquinol methylase
MADYPANDFAFHIVLNALAEADAETVLEVGMGHGNAVALLSADERDLWGIEKDPQRIDESRAMLTAAGLEPDRVIHADIEDPISYAGIRPIGGFDALIALGVLPHVQREVQTLQNMAALVRPGGEVFIEFRNSLFSLFTFNRYTYEFIIDDLLADVPQSVRDAVSEELKPRLAMDKPPSTADASQFHNPFEVTDLFEHAGYSDVEIHPFHYHAAPPMISSKIGDVFDEASKALEHEPSKWRGLFLCSAFLVQATVA